MEEKQQANKRLVKSAAHAQQQPIDCSSPTQIGEEVHKKEEQPPPPPVVPGHPQLLLKAQSRAATSARPPLLGPIWPVAALPVATTRVIDRRPYRAGQSIGRPPHSVAQFADVLAG